MAENAVWDEEAEECVLGAMLLSAQAIDSVAENLTSGDFYRPAHAYIYDAILRLRASGSPADPVTVANALKQSNVLDKIGNPSMLLTLQVNVPSIGSASRYAEIVMDRAVRRRAIGEALELINQSNDLSLNIDDTLESHQSLIATMGSSIINKEPDDISIEEFMKRPKDMMSPWVVHGLIRRRHKLILVGNEGAGKSWVLRFIAICAAYGIEPFRHRLTKPIRTLLVDGENPEDALYDSFELILRQATSVNPQSETVNRLWWRPQGINLRNRVDLAEFENVIRARKPDLVCLGPLYAMYENSSKDFGWETAAREVQTILKRLMVRYDFALMIEDHAPQSSGGAKREMRPYGSSFWRRWPDIGIGMESLNGREDAFELKRWRGDRVTTDWPKTIERGVATGSPWPFLGKWD